MTPGPHTGRILVVEDDRAIRDALRSILEAEGYQVAVAGNGKEALDALERAAAAHSLPHLLIVDLVMPVLNGWDLCAELARRPALAALPVVIVSATSDFDGAPLPSAFALPRVDVLAKPIRFEKLLAAVERHCAAA
jgi:CheY-like chemotaxis protein